MYKTVDQIVELTCKKCNKEMEAKDLDLVCPTCGKKIPAKVVWHLGKCVERTYNVRMRVEEVEVEEI